MLFGTASFCTLTAGMWLFTITSPYFYWFGGPTVFLMLYLIFHCEATTKNKTDFYRTLWAIELLENRVGSLFFEAQYFVVKRV